MSKNTTITRHFELDIQQRLFHYCRRVFRVPEHSIAFRDSAADVAGGGGQGCFLHMTPTKLQSPCFEYNLGLILPPTTGFVKKNY